MNLPSTAVTALICASIIVSFWSVTDRFPRFSSVLSNKTTSSILTWANETAILPNNLPNKLKVSNYATPPASSSSIEKRSNWWFQTHRPAFINQALAIVQAHRSCLTGIYTYANLNILANGTFSSPNFELLQNQTLPFLQRGLEVGLALAPNKSAIESGIASRTVENVADLASRLHLTSIMVDYEPRANITLTHAQSYAKFLTNLCRALHSRNVQCGICVSSWSILTHFGLYHTTGVDQMMSMASTYFGTDIRKNKEWVEKEQGEGVSIEQLHVGIGSTNTLVQKWDYGWNQITFLSFVQWLDLEKGIRSIDLWRTDLDSLDATNGTAPWIYDGLHKFLHDSKN